MEAKEKINVVHFNNGSGGGVLSVIRNLLLHRQHDAIENHVMYTINQLQNPEFTPPSLEGVASVKVFFYSPHWNFYFTSKQLAKQLPDENAILVAHDWLELGMVSQLGLKNPLIQVLHGDFDYYYQLAQLHSKHIAAFIGVSSTIANTLKQRLPNRCNDIYYLPFPVQLPLETAFTKQFDEANLVFFVKDLKEERKQFSVIPEIIRLLEEKKVPFKLHIAGSGYEKAELLLLFDEVSRSKLYYHGALSPHEISKLLTQCNIMLLPSLKEGLPVSVIEAMLCGVVPLVTDWGTAIEHVIIEGKTGFKMQVQDVETYALHIAYLIEHKNNFEAMSTNVVLQASQLFHPEKNTLAYENIFLHKRLPSPQPAYKAYGSRLDHPAIPNWLVNCIRKRNI